MRKQQLKAHSGDSVSGEVLLPELVFTRRLHVQVHAPHSFGDWFLAHSFQPEPKREKFTLQEFCTHTQRTRTRKQKLIHQQFVYWTFWNPLTDLRSKCWWSDVNIRLITAINSGVCFVFAAAGWNLPRNSSAFHLEEDWHPNLQSLSHLELERHGAHFPQQTQVVNTQQLEYTPNTWTHPQINAAALWRMWWVICLSKK